MKRNASTTQNLRITCAVLRCSWIMRAKQNSQWLAFQVMLDEGLPLLHYSGAKLLSGTAELEFFISTIMKYQNGPLLLNRNINIVTKKPYRLSRFKFLKTLCASLFRLLKIIRCKRFKNFF